MPVAGGTEGWRTADRLDPFWGGMWSTGASAMWVSRRLAASQVASGLAVMPPHLSMSIAQAREHLASARGFGARLAAMGVLDQWRTASSEQMVALTGHDRLGAVRSRDLAAMWVAGIADHGTFSSALLPGAALTARAMLYRPSRSRGSFEEAVAPLLTYEQRVAVTAGTSWDHRRQYDRHNLLTTELGLRVAETCPVGTVLGEKVSTVDLLTGSGLGRESSSDERAADMTVVRRDGMRIAVELTASAGPDFTEKVRRWARLLASEPMARTGLFVLFVEAAPPEVSASGKGNRVRREVYKAVARTVREFAGQGVDSVAGRMGVVSWSQWFSGPGMASAEFAALEVDRPIGPVTDTWVQGSVLDEVEVPFVPRDDFDPLAVVTGSSMLLGTPHWMRHEAPAHLWPILAGDVGWSDGLPVRSPARPDQVTGFVNDATLGVLGVTRLPRRLRADVADPRPADSVAVAAAPVPLPVAEPSALEW